MDTTNENELRLFDSAMEELVELRSQHCKKPYVDFSVTIDQFATSLLCKLHASNLHSNEVAADLLKIKVLSEEVNRVNSGDLNVFRMFGVSETRHSHILADLLKPHGSHGQRHLFLNEFLDLLSIERKSDHETWTVTAEAGRVDVLLKRNDPHSVIVVENKSNYAIDQPNQLYRYWFQEIYSTIRSRKLSEEYILHPPETLYQLIYLSPAHWKTPNESSLRRPDDWPSELPDVVPLELRFLLFGEFVVQWLRNSLEKIPSGNHRIGEYIKQYLELWT